MPHFSSKTSGPLLGLSHCLVMPSLCFPHGTLVSCGLFIQQTSNEHLPPVRPYFGAENTTVNSSRIPAPRRLHVRRPWLLFAVHPRTQESPVLICLLPVPTSTASPSGSHMPCDYSHWTSNSAAWPISPGPTLFFAKQE